MWFQLRIDGPDWVGASALFEEGVRAWACVVIEHCELLALSRDAFAKFSSIMPSIVPTLRMRQRQQTKMLSESSGRERAEESLQQLQTSARELAHRAQIRLDTQTEHLRRWRAQQEKDDRARFIYSLVPAYSH